MSRPLRIEYSGAWYHVMNRGRRGDEIFNEASDYKMFLKLCLESIELWNIKIACYCLMPNHYHLLIKTPDGNLSRVMRHINGVYTQRYNSKYRIDGQLFRGRYKAVLVSDDKYLLEVLRYVHLNPFKAKLVEKTDEYEWSSHNGYMSYSKKWDWIYKDYLLSFFSKKRSLSIKKYNIFMRSKEKEETLNFYENKRTMPVLGSIGFKDWVKRSYYQKLRDLEISESRTLAPGVDTIIKEICNKYGIEASELYKSRRGYFNEARNVSIYFMRQLRGEPLNKICEIMKLKHYSSVSSIIVRVKARCLENRKFKIRLDKLKECILKSQEQT